MRAFLLLLLLSAPVAISQQQPSPDRLFESAIEAQQRGDYPAAIREYRALLQAHPEMIEARVNFGAALAHTGQFDAAIAEYRKALVAAPDKPSVRMDLGLAYYKKGDLKNATEQFEAVRRDRPTDPQLAILLGDTYVRQKKSEQAVAMLTPLEADNAENLDFEYVMGEALIQSDKRREGVARMEKVARAGNMADAYMLAGVALIQLNEGEQARRDLEAALRLNPGLPGIYTQVGIARDWTGDKKAAEEAFREALKSKPDDFDANLYLGAILYKRRAMDEAKVYLDKALALDSSSPLARYESAMWKSTSGQYEAAAAELERLVKDQPDWLQPHVELVSLYYRLHRPADGAREKQIVDRLNSTQQTKGPGTAIVGPQ